MHWLTALSFMGMAAAAFAAPPNVTHYFDESTNRHGALAEGDFGKISITFRIIGGPGASYRWFGDGTRKEDEVTFSQIVGEEQDRGTIFVAKATDTKLEVDYKPKQRMPMDAGINGTYRRISEDKRESLAKKEASLADDALGQVLRTAPRSWLSDDRAVAAEWKNRWPELRSRWVNLVFRPASPAPSAAGRPPVGAKGGDSASAAPTADYWIAISEATGAGLGFINQQLDRTVPGVDGEYDDGFGGHVSVRQGKDGFMRFTLTCARGSGDLLQAGELYARIAEAELAKDKSGGFTATYTHADSELKPGDAQATVKFRKTGHFLIVETQNAQRYCGRGWFDGVYRWSPVPQE